MSASKGPSETTGVAIAPVVSADQADEPIAERADAPPAATEQRSLLRTHVPSLDGLRGLAVLGVMAFHFSPYQIPGASRLTQSTLLMLHAGQTGVQLFFVLSGYLITGILLSTKHDPRYFRNFYARRSLRIFPLYYASLLIAIAIPYAWRRWVGHDASVSFSPLLVYASYTTNIAEWFGVPTGDAGHFWTLAVEEHFYLVWPLLVFMVSTRRLLPVCLGAILLAIASRWYLSDQPWGSYFTLSQIDSLAAGAILAWLQWSYTEKMPQAGKVAMVGFLITGPLLMASFLVKSGSHDFVLQIVKPVLLSAVFSMVILIALTARPTSLVARGLSLSPLRLIGKYSYGLYVWHGLMVGLLASIVPLDPLRRMMHSDLLGVFACFVIKTAIAFVVAAVSWHVIEKPFITRKRHFAYQGAST